MIEPEPVEAGTEVMAEVGRSSRYEAMVDVELPIGVTATLFMTGEPDYTPGTVKERGLMLRFKAVSPDSMEAARELVAEGMRKIGERA